MVILHAMQVRSGSCSAYDKAMNVQYARGRGILLMDEVSWANVFISSSQSEEPWVRHVRVVSHEEERS